MGILIKKGDYKIMVTGTQIRNLAFDMQEIGLNIHNEKDIQSYIKRLEESLTTAKFIVDKPTVITTTCI